MSANLDKVKTKIAALLARAKDKASSLNECEKALAVAHKMMAEHSLTLEDIQQGNVKREDFEAKSPEAGFTSLDVYCGPAIGRFCDVKAFKHLGQIVFFGYSVDVELAIFVRDMINRTGDYEWKLYMNGLRARITKIAPEQEAKLYNEFCGGFSERIKERMHLLTEREQGALMVLKMALVEAAFDAAAGGGLGEAPEKEWYITPADLAGRNAADKVQLNRAVDGKQKQKQIK